MAEGADDTRNSEDMPEEIELKLRLRPQDIDVLRRCRLLRRLACARARTRRLVSIYYDTPDLALLRMALSLRVRRMTGRWYQSVKTAGTVRAGLHSRLEWEDCLRRGRPDFARIARIDDARARQLATPAMQQALRPIFSTDVKRTEWRLAFESSTIELALDVGHLVLDGHPEAAICELELELLSGRVSDLTALAAQLQARFELFPEPVSKAALGYRLYRARQAAGAGAADGGKNAPADESGVRMSPS